MEAIFSNVFISDEIIRTIRMLQTGDEENTKSVEIEKCTNDGIISYVDGLGKMRDFLIDVFHNPTCIDSESVMEHLCFIRNMMDIIDSFRVRSDLGPYSELN